MDDEGHSGVSSATYVAQSLRQALAGFDCAICMQLFVEPRVLPCGHSFCTSCIAMLLVGPAPHKCAMCKRNLVVPENDVNKLPKNYALISAASSSSSNSVSNVTDEANYIVRCSEHAQETAQLYCQDCSVRVCNKCIEARTHLRHALISAQQHYAEQVASIVALRDRAKRGAQLLEQYSRERNSILQESRADAERIRSHVHELIHSGIAALTHLQSRIDSEIQGVAYDVELHLESVNRKFGERAAEMMATLSLSRSEHDLTGWLEHAERLQSRVEELERCVAGPLTHPPGIQLEAHFEQQIVSFRQTADSLRELLFRKRQCIIYRQGERDGVMFMIGGSDKRGVSGQVRLFNPYKRVWVTISAELHEARECAASAVLRSTVYVCGGRSASTCLASCEAFDPQVGLWSPIASLCAPRYAHAVLSLGEALYAVGGQHEQQTLSSVEKYEPETDKWTDVRPMSAARGHVAAAAFKGRAVAIGGRDQNGLVTTCEAFDPQSGDWQPIAALNFSRCGAAAAVWNERLFVFGGQGASGSFEVFLEEYNAAEDKWSAFEETLESRPRVGFGVAVTPAYIAIVGGQKDVAKMHRCDWWYQPSLRRFAPVLARGPKCNNVAVAFCPVDFEQVMLHTQQVIVQPSNKDEKVLQFAAW